MFCRGKGECSRRSRPSREAEAGTARSGPGRAVVWRGGANPGRRAPFWHCVPMPMGGAGGNTFPLVSLEWSFPTAAPMTAGELARRLITLIYAGRNRMDMIRRELPRTDNAGWIRRSFRTILVEDSPFRGFPAVIGAAVGKDSQLKVRLLSSIEIETQSRLRLPT